MYLKCVEHLKSIHKLLLGNQVPQRQPIQSSIKISEDVNTTLSRALLLAGSMSSNRSKYFLLQCGFQLDAKKLRGKTHDMPIIPALKPQMIVYSCWQNGTLFQTFNT